MISPSAERDAREALVKYAQLVYTKGWVANHDGNLTVRVAPGRYVATPTSTSKGDIDARSLIVVDDKGKRIAGTGRPFSELALHLHVYRSRPDVTAVIHAHPPHATAMACAGVALNEPFIAEAVVSLGERIPLVPFGAPGTPAFVGHLNPFLPFYDGLLLENHGALTYGTALEQAFLRMELIEHLARIATLARTWGGTRPLPREVVSALLAKRRKAGLGPEARGLSSTPPSSTLVATQPPPARPSVDSKLLTRVITEELNAILDDSHH